MSDDEEPVEDNCGSDFEGADIVTTAGGGTRGFAHNDSEEDEVCEGNPDNMSDDDAVQDRARCCVVSTETPKPKQADNVFVPPRKRTAQEFDEMQQSRRKKRIQLWFVLALSATHSFLCLTFSVSFTHNLTHFQTPRHTVHRMCDGGHHYVGKPSEVASAHGTTLTHSRRFVNGSVLLPPSTAGRPSVQCMAGL